MLLGMVKVSIKLEEWRRKREEKKVSKNKGAIDQITN